jgi:hypothetical protein
VDTFWCVLYLFIKILFFYYACFPPPPPKPIRVSISGASSGEIVNYLQTHLWLRWITRNVRLLQNLTLRDCSMGHVNMAYSFQCFFGSRRAVLDLTSDGVASSNPAQGHVLLSLLGSCWAKAVNRTKWCEKKIRAIKHVKIKDIYIYVFIGRIVCKLTNSMEQSLISL